MTIDWGAVRNGVLMLADLLPEQPRNLLLEYAGTFDKQEYEGRDPTAELLGVQAGLVHCRNAGHSGVGNAFALVSTLVIRALATRVVVVPGTAPASADAASADTAKGAHVEPGQSQSIFQPPESEVDTNGV